MSEFTREAFLARIDPKMKKDTYLLVWGEEEELKLIGVGLNNTVLVKHLDGRVDNVAFDDVKGMNLK
ncbi:hypothetical protein [Corynebacterium callunae]|uniref:hypothetical protein n=1 Tax=Corynebacterium callunae TaxID=1721 RepID=UPI001FFE3926|nr:hypothetical protein [Corynebacterium callunae]MCK2200515.1 hypothetical protein [Corynebacterium callunae]